MTRRRKAVFTLLLGASLPTLAVAAPPPSVGTAVTYDPRFGTGNVTVNGTGGWFVFDLHSGNRRVWVDGSKADNTGDGLTAATAKKDLEAGFTVFTNGLWAAGDQLMVANGSTYTTSTSYNGGAGGMCNRAGISATYPLAFLCYDRADPTNTAKYGKLTGNNRPTIQVSNNTAGNMFSNASADAGGSYAFQGFIFDCLNADNASIAYYQGSQHNDIAYQNCVCNTGELTFEGSVVYDATGTSYFQRVNISKCAFFGSWTSSSNVAGCYFHSINGLYVQDNVWAHCGWKIGGTRDDGVLGGAAGTNHAHYFAAANKAGQFDRNVYVDSSYDGANLRGNCAATCIVSLDEPVVGNIGAYSSTFHEAPDGVTITVDDWLMMGGAPLNASTPAGYGPQNTNTLTGSYLKNIAAFDNPTPKPFIASYNSGGGIQNIVSITNVGTTATLTTDAAHGFTTGDKISLAANSPAAYNRTRTAVTVLSPTTLSYTMLSDPGGNATVIGKYTASAAPMFLAIDKVHSYNYASAWESLTWATSLISNTYTNIISDQLAAGVGNAASIAGTFSGYKTRDQVIATILIGIGLTPAATAYQRKAQIVNAMLCRPDLPWPLWFIWVGFTAMGLTPTYTIPAYSAYTDSPTAIYATALADLTISTLNFARGTSATALLSGVCALPVLTSGSLPSGFTITGRVISYDGTGSGAATPSVTIRETTQDGSLFHDTVFTFNISASDVTAPTLSSPTGTQTGATTASLGVTTDEGNGTLYYVVTTSGTTPTKAQVKAGQDNAGAAAAYAGSQAISSTGAKTASATGLTASTAYFAHFMHEDAATNQSTVVTSSTFTTAGASLGSEIVVNGTFAAGTGWTLDGSCAISGGTLNVTGSVGYGTWQANAGIVSGHTYRVVFDITARTSGSVQPYIGSISTGLTSRNTVGTFSVDAVADSSNELGFLFSSFVGSIDNFSVKEVL